MDGLETVTPEVETPAIPETPETETSVASHAAQFDPIQAKQAPREEPTPAAEPVQPAESTEKPRHRAQSQKARPEDVPRISELTRKLREAERELERLRTAPPSSSAPASSVPPPRETAQTPQAATPASGFTEKEPSLDDFMDQPDPYSAWQRAVNRYDRRKDAWEEQQQARTAAQQTAAQQQTTALLSAYAERERLFKQTATDWADVMKGSPVATEELTPTLQRAILEDDNGPQIGYYLAQHPDVFDSIMLDTLDKDATDRSVAILRRRLNSELTRTQAAATGSAAAMKSTSWTSRPPNPVRTSPLKTGDDPPGDGHSLAEHAKHYQPKRR